MAEARRRDAWDRTADLMTLLANLQTEDAPFRRDDFHPWSEPTREPPGMGGFADALPHSTLKASST